MINNPFLDAIAKQSSFQKSLVFNSPYEYKGVSFYPVMVDRIVEFNACVEILKIRQERQEDKTLKKLPYLWFLIYAYENWQKYSKPEYTTFIPALLALLNLVTNSATIDIHIERKENGGYSKCLLLINDVAFNAKEFGEIRNIIFRQNAIENTFDDFINEDAEKAVLQGRLNDMKKSGYVPPTLDELVNKFCVYMQISKTKFKQEYSVKDFNLFTDEMSSLVEYKIMRTGEASGMVSYKNPIKSWLSGKEKYDMFAHENTNYRNSDLMKI